MRLCQLVEKGHLSFKVKHDGQILLVIIQTFKKSAGVLLDKYLTSLEY